jgi:hypothetical protein
MLSSLIQDSDNSPRKSRAHKNRCSVCDITHESVVITVRLDPPDVPCDIRTLIASMNSTMESVPPRSSLNPIHHNALDAISLSTPPKNLRYALRSNHRCQISRIRYAGHRFSSQMYPERDPFAPGKGWRQAITDVAPTAVLDTRAVVRTGWGGSKTTASQDMRVQGDALSNKCSIGEVKPSASPLSSKNR